MGHYESPNVCADCGVPVTETTRHNFTTGRDETRKHYYIIGASTARRIVCPACYVSVRNMPMVFRGSTNVRV